MNENGYTNDTKDIKDQGGEPLIVNIDRLSKVNTNFRTALWTGDHLQATLMSIPPRGDIGWEAHPHLDQFLRIESGRAFVMMGKNKDDLTYQQRVDGHYAVVVPAGTWHNIINVGTTPLKLFSIYAPPQHPFGTVHRTKADAETAESQG